MWWLMYWSPVPLVPLRHLFFPSGISLQLTSELKISSVISWRSMDELISYVLLWTPSHGRAKAGQPARTYIQQLSADTRCRPEDLPEGMDDWEGWRKRVRDIRVDGMTWWWWLILIHLHPMVVCARAFYSYLLVGFSFVILENTVLVAWSCLTIF